MAEPKFTICWITILKWYFYPKYRLLKKKKKNHSYETERILLKTVSDMGGLFEVSLK